MNTKRTRTAVLMLFLLVSSSAAAQEPQADEQAAMIAAAAPGDFHAFLAGKAGSWNVVGKMWGAPGEEPMVSETSAEAQMILGGRFLYETMQGEIMGQPFEGLGITGCDNATGIITSVWYDNSGTATNILTGTCGVPGGPMDLTGTARDPMTGLDMKVHTRTTFVSEDESLFEYFTSGAGGAEVKVMELHYTRAD